MKQKSQRAVRGGTWLNSACHSRSGTTLSEVLISLFVMSLGVVSVATLFPISVLRALQATQLTNATIARYNAEAMLDVPTNTANNIPANSAAGLNGIATAIGVPSATTAPVGLLYSAAVAIQANNNNVAGLNPAPRRVGAAIVDPIGYRIGTLSTLLLPDGVTYGFGSPSPILPRVDGGLYTLATADAVARLGDSWKVEYDSVVGLAPPDRFTMPLPATADLSTVVAGLNNPANDAAKWRVVLFDAASSVSQTRTLTGPIANGVQSVSWGAAYPLPTSFPPSGLVGRVVLQSQERRYTWMLLVRQSGGTASIQNVEVDVVAFYGRTFSPIDETIFSNGGNLVLDPTQNVVGQTTVPNQAVIQYNTGGTPPHLKKGSFAIDPENGVAYRIVNTFVNTGAPVGTASVTVVLDRNASAPTSSLVFMRGIVDVYPLGVKRVK